LQQVANNMLKFHITVQGVCLAALSQRQQQGVCLVPPQVLPQPLVLSSLPAPLEAQHSQLLPLVSPLAAVALDSRTRSTDSQHSQSIPENQSLAESDNWICCS
jgi:hypothetical protein